MSGWETYDDEAKLESEKIKIGFMINFKKMNVLLERIDQETKEWDNKYPKNELLKMWGSIMVIIMILSACSYSIFALATAPFIFFYLYVLIQMAKTWKRFQYSQLQFWLMTILGLIVAASLGITIQFFVTK